MQEGYAFRAMQPGGGSTGFLTEDHLDLAMDFDSLSSVGSRLGTGTAIVLDDRTCPVGMVQNLEHFLPKNPVVGAPPVETACPGSSASLPTSRMETDAHRIWTSSSAM